jgi:hypothetical protein
MDVAVFLTGLVVTVATIVVAMAVAAGLIGKSLSPKRGGEGGALDFEADLDTPEVPEP